MMNLDENKEIENLVDKLIVQYPALGQYKKSLTYNRYTLELCFKEGVPVANRGQSEAENVKKIFEEIAGAYDSSARKFAGTEIALRGGLLSTVVLKVNEAMMKGCCVSREPVHQLVLMS